MNAKRSRSGDPDPESPPAASSSEGAAEKVYLTPSEVAAMLHVSPKTVNRWADNGLIPCVTTLGGHRRYHTDAVQEAVRRIYGDSQE